MNKLILYFAAVSSMLVSCSTAIFDEEEEIESGTHFLKVSTVSPDDEVLYPVHVYAYDANKEEVSTLDINSASDDLSMELSTGTYTIAAVSGSTDFSKGYNTAPLMLAKSNVTITTKDVDAKLAMNYAVAGLSFAFDNVPENVTSVEVSINSVYTRVSTLGVCSNEQEKKLGCTKDDVTGVWKTDTVYVLPTEGETLTFTIAFGFSDGTYKPHTYTYKGTLLAGTPYYFTGSYDSGEVNAKVTLTLSAAEWNEAVVENFSFGEGVNNNNNNQSSSDAAVFYVDEMPAPCSVWNGHVVATVDDDGNALLLSLNEWENVSSADEEADNPTQASVIATGYEEGNIKGWEIPTEEQAAIFIESRVELIGALGLKNLENKQHLCSNALKWYNLYSRKVQETTKNNKYYLRLVKPVKFIKNN